MNDVTQVKAGRELDALVAERVMGAIWESRTPAGRKRVLRWPNGPTLLDVPCACWPRRTQRSGSHLGLRR